MFNFRKAITYASIFYFYGFINILLKTKLGFMLNNIPWHIEYAIALGLEPKEFDEHSPKVLNLSYAMYMITYSLY